MPVINESSSLTLNQNMIRILLAIGSAPVNLIRFTSRKFNSSVICTTTARPAPSIAKFSEYQSVLLTFDQIFDNFTKEWNEKVMSNFKEGSIYTVLFIGRYRNEDNMNCYATLSNSIRVSTQSNGMFIYHTINTGFNLITQRYNCELSSNIIVKYKEWIENVTDIQIANADKHLASISKLPSPSPTTDKLLNINEKDLISFDLDLDYEKAKSTIQTIALKNDNFLVVSWLQGRKFELQINHEACQTPLLRAIDQVSKSLIRRIYDQYNLTQIKNLKDKSIISNFKLSFDYLEKQLKEDEFINNYIAMDLETYGDENGFGQHKVYACGYRSSSDDAEMYFINDFSDSHSMIGKMFMALCQPQYQNHKTIYFHNFARYDSMFIVQGLLNAGFKIRIQENNNGEIIEMKISKTMNSKRYTFKILDSFLILNSGLDNLARDFNIARKLKFPHRFVNVNTLNYIGPTPAKMFYDNINDETYNALVKRDWNLKDEVLHYLNRDISSLYEVIDKFAHLVYDNSQLNITKIRTSASLAFKTYLSSSLKANWKIPIIKGGMFRDIQSGYIGGLVNVYRPQLWNGYYYDVVSLYPSIMKTQLMPLGKIVLTNNPVLDSYFGFVYAEIICDPNKVQFPFLPMKKADHILCSPYGEWSGWYFSEELKLAREHGYEIHVVKGYTFSEKKLLFVDYIDKFFAIKNAASVANNPSLKHYAKLQLNSLYGRFGLKPITKESRLVPVNDVMAKESQFNLLDSIKVTDNVYYMKWDRTPDPELLSILDPDINIDVHLSGENITSNSSISIAAAITAYSRMKMYQILLEYKDHVYYSDTDSIVVDIPLAEQHVGNDLGQFKLEHVIKEGIFIAPKLYYIETVDGQIIIKSKGLNANEMNRADFIQLLNDQPLIKSDIRFFKKFAYQKAIWKELQVKVQGTLNNRQFVLDNLTNKIGTKPLYVQSNSSTRRKG
uniref:DNA polymerase n=1 Tax=Synchytrium endobioticum TaxID=286115 RepID=A0A4P8NW22_9FUNG|nr:DNA polymerase type B [Synchytrium endobioticum]QCQ68450.1 DNA polymerase type B [Synchytrium endobioticum]QCQ68469.1 DNA polymerase type B [Synchytrium endobioticum]QCQ68488.1 DNA polymerase type B [Synchytrium endobioticum]QCQ68507.1 DNA polymerase type B [Synchytrium endobioticum]QCQ68526.1 DNA polymerase type B [Synchytrium endobioticum]